MPDCNEGEAMAALPRYECHKTVHALKIRDIEVESIGEDGAIDEVLLVFVLSNYAPRVVSAEWFHRHSPQNGGYWVLYADGYESFSPASAFEEGYTLVDAGSSGLKVSEG